MEGLYSHQKVEPRRGSLPHLKDAKRDNSMSEFSSGFGKIILNSLKRFSCAVGSLLLLLGKKLLVLLKNILYALSLLLLALGKKTLILLKTVFYALGNCLLVLGKKLFLITKKYFFLLVKEIRYNPVVHKVSLCTCLAGLVVGAVFLVAFALFSPELPSENLMATIDDVSWNVDFNDYTLANIVLSGSEDDWAVLTAYDDKEFARGAGSETQDRSEDFEYIVRPGETLSEIAYAYKISYDFLAWYNKITNVNRIRAGTKIIIPSVGNVAKNEAAFKNQKAKQKQPQPQPARNIKSIQITHESKNNGNQGITVSFSIVNPPSGLTSYEWDLGDGRRSFRENPSHDYSAPRTYTVRLTARDGSGTIYRSNHIYIDIPLPASSAEHSTTRFVTLSYPDEHFVVNGTVKKVSRYPNINDILDLSESDQHLTKIRFKKSGYFGVTIEENGREQFYSVFVSPIPSMHADQAMINHNWYRTQFNTGTPSNCGPASVSMAISWGANKYFPTSAVRQSIGWSGNGATGFEDLIKVLRNQNVEASIKPLYKMQDLKDVIDSGGIAIILFHTDGISKAKGDPAQDLFGKYYNDSVGHYIVMKGYSLNEEYIVVHDPIPSDWGANSFRFSDEISMIGRNRYFPADELLKSLRRNDMIVIKRAK